MRKITIAVGEHQHIMQNRMGPERTPSFVRPKPVHRVEEGAGWSDRPGHGTVRLMLDFDAYLRRIGLDPAGKPAWQAVHRAHATTIPFENLDSHRGIPVSLEQADLERKLVASRRGGYCFEHNLLLASALEHLGLGVEPMLARVSVGGAPRETRPAGHLVLRATDGDGRQWHADVGFGLGTLLDPIPFGPAGVQVQREAIPSLLARRFGLPGFGLGPDGRVVALS
jgi:hypothetical protein